VAEKFSGRPGEYFTLEQTLNGIEAILSGKGDSDKAAEAPKEKPKTPLEAEKTKEKKVKK
ncbi:MAG: F0F1 ATP synthase subunit beta, partial [Candidatus Saccharimonadales bacterium]